LLDLPFSDTEWERIGPAQRRWNMQEAARLLLLQSARSAVVILVLEDLHWGDTESLAILKAIIGSIGAAKILVVATSRPEFAHGWPRYSYSSLLRLSPLDASDADKLLRAILDDGQELAGLRRRLIAHSGGEPLFLEEMARSLIETGALRKDGTGFHLTRDHQEIEVPSSLQAVIASRIDGLPVESRTVLQIASVIGKDVAIGPLRAVAELTDDELFAQLAVLQSLEFLRDISQPPNIEYTFKHALTHSVTYEGMLQKHRHALHERVMSAIELLHADRLDEFTERLAWHAAQASNYAKAVEYNYRAGVRANARSAYREAVVFLQRALDALALLPDTPTSINRGIDIYLHLRIALLASGDLMQVHAHLERAEALAIKLGDRRRLMPIVISRSTILVNLGSLDQAIEAGLRGRALAEQDEDHGCYVSACFALGQAYWNRGDFKSAAVVLSRGVELIGLVRPGQFTGTTGSLSVLCRVSLSHTHSFMGEMQQACRRAQEALDAARDTGRPYDLSYAHTSQGLVNLLLGNIAEAIDHFEQALRFTETSDIKLLFPHTARYLGRAYALAGRLEEARVVLEHAVDYTSQRSLVGLQGWCAAALGLSHLLSGNSGAARSTVKAASDLAQRFGYVPLRAHTARLMGAIAARENSSAALRKAENWLREGASMAAAIGMQPEVAHCHYELAAVLTRTRRVAEARTALMTAARVFHSAGISVYASAAEQELAALSELASQGSAPRRTPRATA
jgi:tetratricopeptide (TPR) repeat protein